MKSICTSSLVLLASLHCFYVASSFGAKQDDAIMATGPAAGNSAAASDDVQSRLRMLEERELPPLVPPSFRNTRRQLTPNDPELDPVYDQLTAEDVASAGLGYRGHYSNSDGQQQQLGGEDSIADDLLDVKRTMGMLRMGRAWGNKRTMGMLRMGRSSSLDVADGLTGGEGEQESKRTMSMLRMGRRAAQEEKRTMGMLRMGRASADNKRTMGMLRMGRSVADTD
jgi:hypothetical protein